MQLYSAQCMCMHSGTPMSLEYWWFVWHMSKEQMKLDTDFQDSRRILCAPLLLSHPAKHYGKRWVVPHLGDFLLYFHRRNVIISSLFSVLLRAKGDAWRDGREKHREKNLTGILLMPL